LSFDFSFQIRAKSSMASVGDGLDSAVGQYAAITSYSRRPWRNAAEFNSSSDDPPGLRNYWTAEYLEELGDDALAVFVEHSRNVPEGTPSQSAILPWGGAVKDIAGGETPLTSRHANWHLLPFCLWERREDDQRCMAWGRGIRDAMKPFATGGVYLNFIGDEGEDRIVAAYGRKTYDRLARVKADWDPDNVFHGNQNIKPKR